MKYYTEQQVIDLLEQQKKNIAKNIYHEYSRDVVLSSQLPTLPKAVANSESDAVELRKINLTENQIQKVGQFIENVIFKSFQDEERECIWRTVKSINNSFEKSM
jgi:hypothetical protein